MAPASILLGFLLKKVNRTKWKSIRLDKHAESMMRGPLFSHLILLLLITWYPILRGALWALKLNILQGTQFEQPSNELYISIAIIVLL